MAGASPRIQVWRVSTGNAEEDARQHRTAASTAACRDDRATRGQECKLREVGGLARDRFRRNGAGDEQPGGPPSCSCATDPAGFGREDQRGGPELEREQHVQRLEVAGAGRNNDNA